jgi:hypothetical protein
MDKIIIKNNCIENPLYYYLFRNDSLTGEIVLIKRLDGIET